MKLHRNQKAQKEYLAPLLVALEFPLDRILAGWAKKEGQDRGEYSYVTGTGIISRFVLYFEFRVTRL